MLDTFNISILNFILKFRRPAIAGLHLVFMVVANYLAFWLRFDGTIPASQFELFTKMLPWLLAIRGLTFIPFRLYEGLWRYTSIWDLRNIIAGVVSSTFFFYLLVRVVFGATSYPRSIFIVDSILLIFFLGGIRLTWRVYHEFSLLDHQVRILVYEAGDAGDITRRLTAGSR